MPRPLLLPAVIALSLAACSPTTAPAASPAPASSSPAPVAVASGEVAPGATSASAPATAPAEPAVAASSASLVGDIRDGNRPPPALRVCAHPLDGGTPTCVATAAGATSYRIEVAAGRYVVAGQALEDPGMKFAHAERIRCIRAPCPPDTAIVVEVAAGDEKGGIDLSVGEALPPG